ncbi:MAG: hypothetical protein IIA92_04430 [Chloroflexi bacterium]|nr:hypothetical protein [Chloroflexota bacterium]
MQIEVEEGFPYPNFFVISGRASGGGVEKVGVFIVKQTVQLDGSIGEQQEILMADTTFEPEAPADGEDGFHVDNLAIRIESDIVPSKPGLDLAAVRDEFNFGGFGQIRIDRGAGFLPDPPLNLDYGWRTRLSGARKLEAGNALDFRPDLDDPSKLPDGFNNTFFNGSNLTGDASLAAHLTEGEKVEFNGPAGVVRVTIPPRPTLAVKIGDIIANPPVVMEEGADTVVYDVPAGHFLITWRATFPWEDRLEEAVLEVS